MTQPPVPEELAEDVCENVIGWTEDLATMLRKELVQGHPHCIIHHMITSVIWLRERLAWINEQWPEMAGEAMILALQHGDLEVEIIDLTPPGFTPPETN